MQTKALCVREGHAQWRPPVSLTKTWKVMRLMTFFLAVAVCHVTAASVAQTVTYSARSAPLTQVLSEIEKQTGYSFFYDRQDLKDIGPVTVDLKSASVTDALDQVLAGLPLRYELQGTAIALVRKPDAAANPSPVAMAASPGDIHGHVSDSTGSPLQGATVTIKGEKKAIITDSKGNFMLKNISPDATIIVSFTGFESQQVRLRDRTSIEVVLHQSNSPLDEAQVVAYGTTTQRYSVGSIAKVSAEDIAEQPVANPLQALEGRVPGLVVTQSGGAPGSSVAIQIRGQNSLTQGSNPLIIIDGVPLSAQDNNINQMSSVVTPNSTYQGPTLTQEGNPMIRAGLSPLNSINPADIESIEVLKDADATSIYGSRGANGVILITTKRGKSGKTKFKANVWTGGSQATRTQKLLDTQQYLSMRHEAFNNDGITPSANPGDEGYAPDLLLYDTTRYTDYNKTFFGGTAQTQDANISLSGGTAGTTFSVGAGYHHETNMFPGSFADNRGSVMVNLNHISQDKKLTLDFSSNFSFDQNNTSGSPGVLTAFTLPPDYPGFYDSTGHLLYTLDGIDQVSNPYSYLYTKYSAQTKNLISHLQVGYQVLPGLTLRSSFGYNDMTSNEKSINPLIAQDPNDNPVSSASFGANEYTTWIIEPQAEYKKNISSGKLDILTGGTFELDNNTSSVTNGSNYSNDDLLGSLSSAGTITSTQSYALYHYAAIFGRINYIWDNKYILNFSGRRDGSSRFGPGKQFANFGSVGAGWIFTQEHFFQDCLPFLSYGKIRGSYGTTGNDQIGNYQYFSAYSANNTQGYTFQGTGGLLPQNLYNPDYSWEINRKLEAGLELGILKDRILVNADWYRNRSGNQLISYPLPIQAGFYSVIENFAALVQNTGLEFQLLSNNIKSKYFRWITSLNLTIPRNKLVSFPGLASSSYNSFYVVGKSISVLRRYIYKGVNDTTGIYQFQTQDGLTSTPSYPQDIHVVGNLDPKYYGGFRNTFNYKNFGLDLFFEFRKQIGQNYIGQLNAENKLPGTENNQPTQILARWQKQGDHTNIEKFTSQYSGTDASNASSYFVNSSGAYGDASFIRLKTISLSYNIGPKAAKYLRSQGCSIFINAQNLFTITKYVGNDPETQNYFSLPPLKTVVAGLSLNF
jgi:TonB-linked SusC/RagA family outer membrane protein